MDLKIYRASVLTVKTKTTVDTGRRLMGCALVLLTMLSLLTGCGKRQPTVSEVIKTAVQYQMNTVPRPESASIGGEWTLLSAVRSGEEVPDSYGEIYLSNLKKRLKECNGVLSERKYTEYARAALATAAIGETPQEIDGYDLLTPLTDMDKVTKQGINGAAFALLALNAGDKDTEGKAECLLCAAKKQLRNWLLEQELSDGGFALGSEKNVNIDVTAMVVQALAPYQQETKVNEVIERSLDVLSAQQKSDGMFENCGEISCETAAQVLIALSALEIDGQKDTRFVKNENGLIDVLLRFYDGKGGFAHVLDGETDAMATDQALCALVAYQRFQTGSSAFYDMSDCR